MVERSLSISTGLACDRYRDRCPALPTLFFFVTLGVDGEGMTVWERGTRQEFKAPFHPPTSQASP